MRSPSEYYIRYLLLMGLGHRRVNKVLESIGMPGCKSGYLGDLRESMAPPRPFRPEATTGMVAKWKKRQMLWPAFHRDQYMDEATDILGNHETRSIVESLVLSGCPDDVIVQLLHDRTGLRLFEESIRYYRHFFWNRSLLSMEEWDDFLAEYDRGSKLRGLYDEGPDMALWRLGHARQMDTTDMLRTMQAEAFHRFMQSHNTPANDFHSAKTADKWASIFFEASKHLNASEDKLSDVIARFEQICMRHTDGEIPSLEILTVGVHSRKQVTEGEQAPVIDVEVDNATARLQLPEPEPEETDE